jgi:hypothetical protein
MAKTTKVKRTNILLKVKPEQKSIFQQNAKRYTNGNLALWLRTAASLKLTARQIAQIKKESA